MMTGDYSHCRSYTVSCSCHNATHDLDVWIDVEREDDIRNVDVSFYVTMQMPWWKGRLYRLRAAIRLLFTGELEMEVTNSMDAQTAKNFAEALLRDVEHFEKL